jgi:hypothetical protein
MTKKSQVASGIYLWIVEFREECSRQKIRNNQQMAWERFQEILKQAKNLILFEEIQKIFNAEWENVSCLRQTQFLSEKSAWSRRSFCNG